MDLLKGNEAIANSESMETLSAMVKDIRELSEQLDMLTK